MTKSTILHDQSQLNSTNSNTVKRLVTDLTGDSDVGEECYVTEITPSQLLTDLTSDDSNSDTHNESKRKRTEVETRTPSKTAKHLHDTLVFQRLHYENHEDVKDDEDVKV